MGQFYAEIQGSRGEATRMGSKASGMRSHIRGWHVGAAVDVRHENGRDVVYVYRTDGSAGYNRRLIARFDADTPEGEERA